MTHIQGWRVEGCDRARAPEGGIDDRLSWCLCWIIEHFGLRVVRGRGLGRKWKDWTDWHGAPLSRTSEWFLRKALYARRAEYCFWRDRLRSPLHAKLYVYTELDVLYHLYAPPPKPNAMPSHYRSSQPPTFRSRPTCAHRLLHPPLPLTPHPFPSATQRQHQPCTSVAPAS